MAALLRVRRQPVGRALGGLFDLDDAHQVGQVEAAVVVPAGLGLGHGAERRDAGDAGLAEPLGQPVQLDGSWPCRWSAGTRRAARPAARRRRAHPPR
jgi:hypothetical protein